MATRWFGPLYCVCGEMNKSSTALRVYSLVFPYNKIHVYKLYTDVYFVCSSCTNNDTRILLL